MAKTKTEPSLEEPKKEKKVNDFFFANGRRKTATARARLHPFTAEILIGEKKLERGDIYVNNKSFTDYFKGPFAKQYLEEIYRTTNSSNRFITTVLVEGSGTNGQLGAVGLAISRALVKVDPKFKTTLRKKGYMTRDPRSREREKPGLMGARKEKQSPKR